MSEDVIAVAIGKYPKRTVLREATGKVEGKEVTLLLENEIDEYNNSSYWVCGKDGKYGFRIFTFKFFANGYFNKIKKRYNLEE